MSTSLRTGLPTGHLKATLLSIFLATVMIGACGKKDDSSEATQDSLSNIADAAQGAAGSVATESENGTVVSSSSVNGELASGQVRTQATCSFSSARSTCSGAVMTIDWGNCSVGSLTFSGGWTNTYDSGATCTTARSAALPNGSTVTRTSPTGTTITFASGATLKTDTVAHTAWDGTSIPSTGVEVTKDNTGTRSVTIHGLHRVLRGPRGAKWFDHSLTTTGSLTITGTRAAGTRILDGSLTLYHNLASYTAVNTFNTVAWGDPSCACPTSGNVATSLTGSVTGSTTLAFTTTCGQATFTNTSGATSTVTLTQCE